MWLLFYLSLYNWCFSKVQAKFQHVQSSLMKWNVQFEWKGDPSKNQEPWVVNAGSPLTGRTILGKSLSLSQPQFLCLKNVVFG